jgi:PAT family beta-lactamase induction signal transducer AmpG
MTSALTSFAVFRSRRMLVLLALGFASGLPYLLTGQTLQAWLTTEKLDLRAIGAMVIVGLAYNIKFAWAPLLDRFRLPLLGRRRGWALAFQLALAAALVAMSTIDPRAHLGQLAAVAIAVALLSASQDIVLDAYARDVLAPEQRAAGSAVYSLGYRIGVLFASTFALVLASRTSWAATYEVMAALLVIGVVATLVAEEPATAAAPRTLRAAFVEPIADFRRRFGGRDFALLLGFAALYELGYFFATSLMNAFLIRGCGFDLEEIAVVNKGMQFLGLVIGGALSGALAARFGARRVLVPFGAIAAATHLLYALLALAGHNLPMLGVAVLVDNIANAMVANAFVALTMTVSTAAYGAAQLAILTSLSSVGRNVLGPLGDRIVDAVGWSGFFAAAAVAALPGLWMARWVARCQKFADAPPTS